MRFPQIYGLTQSRTLKLSNVKQLRSFYGSKRLSTLSVTDLPCCNEVQKRMQSSMSNNYMNEFNTGFDSSVSHKSPSLSNYKIDTRSKAFLESMEMTKKQVDELNARLEFVRKGGGEKAVQKHLSRNKMLPRQRINMLIDPGTPFMELSPLAGMYSYASNEDIDGQMNVPSAGIVTGIGIVAGVKTMIVANDATVKGVSHWA